MPARLRPRRGWLGEKSKRVQVEAMGGLMVETALLAPLALAWLFWNGWHGGLVFGQGWGISLLLAGTGIATTLPLIWFTAGARLIPLHTMGILQYSGPSIQFLIALFLFNEAVSPARWLTFSWSGPRWRSIWPPASGARGRAASPESAVLRCRHRSSLDLARATPPALRHPDKNGPPRWERPAVLLAIRLRRASCAAGRPSRPAGPNP